MTHGEGEEVACYQIYQKEADTVKAFVCFQGPFKWTEILTAPRSNSDPASAQNPQRIPSHSTAEPSPKAHTIHMLSVHTSQATKKA